MWCHYCDKNNHNTADGKKITKAKQQKKAHSEAKSAPGKKALAFLFEEIIQKAFEICKRVKSKKEES